MRNKPERLKRLSCYGMDLEDLIRRVMEVDPKPLWEQEKEERRIKEKEKARKERDA